MKHYLQNKILSVHKTACLFIQADEKQQNTIVFWGVFLVNIQYSVQQRVHEVLKRRYSVGFFK